jgi:adenylate cyclase
MTRVERRLAAILAADIAGYSRLMGADEEGTLSRLKAHRRALIDPKIDEHKGRIVKTTGDGMLVEFSSVVDAARCAVEMQRAMLDREAGLADDRRIAFRVGINLGDVIVDGDDIFGDGVNIAARLEGLAEPGGVCISAAAHDQLRGKLPYTFADLGEQSLRNIAQPLRVYALYPAAVAALPAVSAPVAAEASAPPLSIAVLPFANLSNDPEEEYFADGITDDVTTDLSRIPGSFVIACNTAFSFKGTRIDVRKIGRDLGVRYVLEGSVRRTGERVRINVQLIDAEIGAHLWADRLDIERADLDKAEDEISGRITQRLSPELVEVASRRQERGRPTNPDLRDLLMQGAVWRYRAQTAENVHKARRAFEDALKLDPESLDARIGLARTLMNSVFHHFTGSATDQALAEQLLLEVLARDPNRPEAHGTLGVVRKTQNRLAEALTALEAALALNPNDARVLFDTGHTLMFLGRPTAAIPRLEKAIRLNPRDPLVAGSYLTLGACHVLLRHNAEAIPLLQRARAANQPGVWLVHRWLAAVLALQGELDEARTALTEMIRLLPQEDSVARVRAAGAYTINPAFLSLAEPTLFAGLRLAGLPEE